MSEPGWPWRCALVVMIAATALLLFAALVGDRVEDRVDEPYVTPATAGPAVVYEP